MAMKKLLKRLNRFKLNNWDFRLQLWRMKAARVWRFLWPLIVNNPPIIHLTAAVVVPCVLTAPILIMWLLTGVLVSWWWWLGTAWACVEIACAITSFIYNWKRNGAKLAKGRGNR